MIQLGLDASMVISDTVSLLAIHPYLTVTGCEQADGDCEVRVDSEQGHAIGGRIGVSFSW